MYHLQKMGVSYIKYLEDLDKNCSLLDFLMKTSELLCKDAQKLQQMYSSNNPLISKSPNNTENIFKRKTMNF